MTEDNLPDIIWCSARLAFLHHQFTPDLKLAWNPRNENSLATACNNFLAEIETSQFPVETWVYDVETVYNALGFVHVYVLGFDLYEEDSWYDDINPNSLFRLMALMASLAELLYGGLDEDQLIKMHHELVEVWGIEKSAPLHRLAIWISEQGESQRIILQPDWKEEQWAQLRHTILYHCNSTGFQFLDMPPAHLYESDTYLPWDKETVEDLREQWREAGECWDGILSFVAWAKEDEHRKQVTAVLNTGCQAVNESQPTPLIDDVHRNYLTWRENYRAVQEILHETEGAEEEGA